MMLPAVMIGILLVPNVLKLRKEVLNTCAYHAWRNDNASKVI